MALQYPSYVTPQGHSPLASMLGGFEQGFTDGRRRLNDQRAVESLYDASFGSPQAAPNVAPLASLLGGSGPAGSSRPSSVSVPVSSPTAARATGGGDVYGGFMGAVRGGISNPYGLAAVASTGQRESGFSATNAYGQWSDPSERGAPGQSGGIMSWRAERLANLRNFARQRGDDPNRPSPETQGLFFLSEDPQLVAALNSAGSVEEAQGLMNNAWRFAGYNRSGGEAGQRLALARSYVDRYSSGGGAPVQVASADGSGPSPETMGALMDGANAARADMGQRPMGAPDELPPARDVEFAPGMQMAQAPASPDLTPILNAIAGGQITGPSLTREQFTALMRSDVTRPIASELAKARMGDPNAAQRAAEFAYKAYRDQVSDQQFMMSHDQRERAALMRANGGPKTSLSPVYGTDENGNAILMQPRDDGTVVRSQMPEGVTLSTGVDRVDAGTHWVLQDKRSGQHIGTIPKDNFGERRDQALGTEAGRVEVDEFFTAPQAYRQANQMLTSIDGILQDPYLGWATGAVGNVVGNMWGTPMRGVRARIDQLGGQAFLQAFESLKGGGQITEIEGLKATQAIARLDTAQSEADYRAALTDLRDVVMSGMRRAEEQMQNPPRTSTGQPITGGSAPAPMGTDPLGLR